jgi:hypothetical protein
MMMTSTSDTQETPRAESKRQTFKTMEMIQN